MADIVQRIAAPRPEPQNTTWLRSAGLPSAASGKFAGAFVQQRTALLVGPTFVRSIVYDTENQYTPVNLPIGSFTVRAAINQQQRGAFLVPARVGRSIVYDTENQYTPVNLPTGAFAAIGAAYPRKYDPWAGVLQNPVYDSTDQPGWIFKSLPVITLTVAQEAPAFAQQRTAILVDVAPGRPIVYEIENQYAPINLPTTPVFTAAFVRKQDPWAAAVVAPEPARQPGWLFANLAAPPAPTGIPAFAQQRSAFLVDAAPGRPLQLEPTGQYAPIRLPTTPTFTAAFAQQRTALLADLAAGRPIQLDASIDPAAPFYRLLQLFAAPIAQQHGALLVPTVPMIVPPPPMAPAVFIAWMNAFAGVFAQQRRELVIPPPGPFYRHYDANAVPPIRTFGGFTPAGILFLTGERVTIPTAEGESAIIPGAFGHVVVIPTIANERRRSGSGG